MKAIKWAQTLLLVGLLLLVTAIFANAPGTFDVESWQSWGHKVATLGWGRGYAAIQGDNPYPPYTSVILGADVRLANRLTPGSQYPGRLTILAFLLLTSLVFWLWTRDLILTAALHVSLILSSAALRYLDVYFAPALILSLWALKTRRLPLFSILYAVACLIKWQPLIIGPFLGLYILGIKDLRQWKQMDFKRLFRQVVLPAGAVVIPTLFVFGLSPILGSLRQAMSHPFLSGNALNFNWILTYLLRALYPETYGGLDAGQVSFIQDPSPRITLLPNILFLVLYISVLVRFFRREKTFEDLIYSSIVGFLAYFTFKTGVHENHLFIPMLLSVILFWLNRDHARVTLLLILMSNANLLVFYGIGGRGLGFSPVILPHLDITLLLSILFTIVFVALWFENVVLTRTPPAAETPLAPPGSEPRHLETDAG